MGSQQMQISKMMASGPSTRSSQFFTMLQPFFNQGETGLDFDKDVIGVSVFLNSIDKWGDPKKKVGR